MKKVESFSELEDTLVNSHPKGLHFKEYKHDSSMSVDDFLLKALRYDVGYNRSYMTYSGGRLQCMPGKNRSLGDIWLITRTYYPEVSLKEVFHLLKKLSSKGMCTAFCKNIKKQVYYSVECMTSPKSWRWGQGWGYYPAPPHINEFGWQENELIKD